jgi:hypothetical protein
MNLEWVSPLLAAAAGCLGLFLSRPERRWIAAFTAAVILTTGAWEASRKYTELKTEQAARERVYRTLIGKTHGFLDFVSEMIFRGSDGWLPKTEDEFFSSHSATIIMPASKRIK